MSSLPERVPPAEVAHLVNERAPELTDLHPIPRFDGVTMRRQLVPEGWLSAPYSIDEVEETLDGIFAQEQPSMTAMERLVYTLGSTVQLNQLISDVSRDRRRLASVSAGSEKHPLGFYKIPLLSKPEYQLRLNIRPGGRATQSRFGRRTVLDAQLDGKQDVHNHEFDAASRVLVGDLLTRIYQFVSEPPLQFHTVQQAYDSLDITEAERSLQWFARQSRRIVQGYPEEHESKPAQIFRADKSNRNVEALELLEVGHVRPIYNAVIRAGGVYSFTHNTFHRDWPLSSSNPTATLFLRGRPDFGPDSIARVLPVEGGGDTPRPKERMTNKEVRIGLTALRDLMARSPVH